MRHLGLPLAMMVLALCGCSEELPKISLVDEMDILGHQVRVEGDPTRATPAPGERATIRWELVFPNATENPELLSVDERHLSELNFLVLECTFPERYLGEPFCQEFVDGLEGSVSAALALAPFLADVTAVRCTDEQAFPLEAEGLRLSCLRGRNQLDFSVPNSPSTTQGRLFRGIACRNGIPVLTREGFACEALSDSSPVEFEEFFSQVPVQQSPTDENRNPDPTTMRVQQSNTLWTPWPSENPMPTNGACEENALLGTSTLPTLAGGQAIGLEFAFESGAREMDGGLPERIRISHRATAGDFARGASYILEDEPLDAEGMLSSRVTWVPPFIRGGGGLVVHFVMGLRDSRGGFARRDHFACVY